MDRDTNNDTIEDAFRTPGKIGCGACGHEIIEQDYKSPLCSTCRTKLANHPIPLPILAVAVVTLLLAIVASAKYPSAMRSAIADERANRAEQSLDYITAEKNLLIVTKANPNYVEGMVRLIKDSYSAKDYAVTADTLDALNGKEIDKDDADAVNAIAEDLQKMVDQKGQTQ